MSPKIRPLAGWPALLLLLLLIGLPTSVDAQTKTLTFRFSDAKAEGTFKVRFVSQNFATFGILVEVPIDANMTAAAKRDKVKKAIQDAFAKELPNDNVAKAFTYNNEMNPPKGNEGLVMGNIPLMIGNTLFGLNAQVNSGKTKEKVDGLITASLDPRERGLIEFASASYDPNDSGLPAVFHAGLLLNGSVFAVDFFAPSGASLTGAAVAHQLWQDLVPLIGTLVHFPDPALDNSDTLVFVPLTRPLSGFGVEFGTTSPSGEVIGSVLVVPAPSTALLLAGGLMVLAIGIRVRQLTWSSRVVRLPRARGLRRRGIGR